MKTIEYIKYYVWKFLFSMVTFFLSFIPKRKKLVLFTAWYGNKYIDNTKYAYEYFLENSNYHPVWMARDKNIYKMLKEQGKPVELFDSFRGRLAQIRAEAVFSTIQFADYSIWLVNKCFFIDLGHGHPVKDSGLITRSQYAVKFSSLLEKKVKYYAIVASELSRKRYAAVGVDKSHIFISDFARNDVLFDEKLRIGKNTEVSEFAKGRKTIVYMPTHRSDGALKMNMEEILPLPDIQNFCEKNNCVFIIKKHFYHRNETEDLSKYNNIFDITNIDDIDPQVLLYQADILISDYSACYVDYMLLKRPLMFYQYDILSYEKNERVLNIDFRKIDIAPISYSKDELIRDLNIVVSCEDTYLDRRMKYAHEYYFDNIGVQNGREKVKKIVDNLFMEADG